MFYSLTIMLKWIVILLCTGVRNRYLIQLTIYCKRPASTLGWQGKTCATIMLHYGQLIYKIHPKITVLKNKENIFCHILPNLPYKVYHVLTKTTNTNSTSICPKSYHILNSTNCFPKISIWPKLKKNFLPTTHKIILNANKNCSMILLVKPYFPPYFGNPPSP